MKEARKGPNLSLQCGAPAYDTQVGAFMNPVSIGLVKLKVRMLNGYAAVCTVIVSSEIDLSNFNWLMTSFN